MNAFLACELEDGRRRQGWGYRPEHDLAELRQRCYAGEPLTDELRAVWRNRRLLHSGERSWPASRRGRARRWRAELTGKPKGPSEAPASGVDR